MTSPPRLPHLLVVDDDAEVRDLLGSYLGEHGFTVDLAAGLGEARRIMAARRHDLFILDLSLLDGDGVVFCRELRRTRNEPIVMLSGRSDPIDRILGIEGGADDYLTKPFHPRELVARLRAVLRRVESAAAGGTAAGRRALRFAGWRLDLLRRELRRADGTLVPLSDAEFDVLAVLAERAQRVVSRDEIFSELHGRRPDAEDRSLDLRISRLRHKIEADPRQPRLVKTVRTGGFLFTEPVEAE